MNKERLELEQAAMRRRWKAKRGPNYKTGALVLEECPARPGKCTCGRCAFCQHPKHCYWHGPIKSGSSRPAWHEFLAEAQESTIQE
jgi:hypothetical protein